MHKSEDYGKIKIKANRKQNLSKNLSKISNFALILHYLIPFSFEILESAITELVDEEVLIIEDDCLCQKRMIRDGKISESRASSGSKGGKAIKNSNTKKFFNDEGYIYLISDEDDPGVFKIGISKEPENRLPGIMKKSSRNNLFINKKWLVENMGLAQESVLENFNDIRQGDWIFSSYKSSEIEAKVEVILNLSKNLSKIKANSEYEYEYNNKEKEGGVGEEKTETPKSKKLEGEVSETRTARSRKKSVVEIPTLDDFGVFARSHVQSLGLVWEDYKDTVRAKYETWVDNGWKDGFNAPIKNWKLKFKTVLPHLKPIKKFNDGGAEINYQNL